MHQDDPDATRPFSSSPRVPPPEPEVPLSADELRLMQALQGTQINPEEARAKGPQILRPDRLATIRPEEKEDPGTTPFPDLPPELIPQRPDGTGALTLHDLAELDRTGTVLPASAAESARAQGAIEHLKHKMAAIAAEFAAGQINHAQFQAIYTRYCEQRAVIERIRSQAPGLGSWRSVAAEGATAYLRQQFAAHVIGCALVNNLSGSLIRTFGAFDLPEPFLAPLLSSLQHASLERGSERTTQIEGGRWVSVAPGERVTTILVFSQEPSAAQRTMICDLNADFERANQRALQRGLSDDPAGLVYPHRTLFDAE